MEGRTNRRKDVNYTPLQTSYAEGIKTGYRCEKSRSGIDGMKIRYDEGSGTDGGPGIDQGPIYIYMCVI